ncbi:hypothetical protein [Dactylosporangium sp. NPDC049140]|uniref:hypothetical protein n=1 Tax=Dactylosporangium sp. NPDC049140 TaxID=3155647 RepID=UPI0033F0E1ED
MGLSRSGVREAVKVLESARVLDVRRGDGTYVTSLAPRLLLEGLGLAVELLQDDTLPLVAAFRAPQVVVRVDDHAVAHSGPSGKR